MTMLDIQRLLSRDKLWEAARSAMEKSTLSVTVCRSSEYRDVHRISLHINDDGTSYITIHDTTSDGTPAPPATEPR